MAYTYDPIFAADPNNTAMIAKDAAITIFDPADVTMAAVTITDVTGSPLTNPVVVNKSGFGPAFQHPTLDRVGWSGGGFTGYFTSYEGMKTVATDAKVAAEAAQTAAETAGVDAAAVASAALADAVADADAAAASAAASAALVGAPADAAITAAINNGASATRGALNATILDNIREQTSGLIEGAKLTVYGHSYTPVPGYYVTANTGEWSSKLATKLGITRTSYGESGVRMIEMAVAAIGTALPGAGGNRSYPAGKNGAVILECEMNDAISGPATTAARKGFEHALRAFLATVTAATRVEASTATVIAGTWSNYAAGSMSAGNIRFSDTASAALEFTDISAPAGKVHLLTLANANGSATSSFTVSVDTVDQGITYTGQNEMEPFTSNATGTPYYEFSPAVLTITVPATGTHTIRVTRSAAVGPEPVYVDALLIPPVSAIPVLVCKDPPVGNLASVGTQNAWAANYPALHALIDSVTAEFPSARVVDLGPGWDPATMVAAGDANQFHPGEVGMQHIADLLEAPLTQGMLRRIGATVWA